MKKPLFSICVIARNEAETLPKRLLPSVKHFIDAGGELVFLDTGSTDETVKIAKDAGCVVHEVGNKFVIPITKKLVNDINKTFVVGSEEPVITMKSRIFDFAAARNYCDSLASNDMVLITACDESFTALDIEALNALIKQGHKRIDVSFVHSHDQFGRPSLQFHRNYFYDRTECRWECVVHEVLKGRPHPFYAPATVIKLEHWQETNRNRTSYLPGLAYDCWGNRDKDRQSHYFAREMMYYGRYHSAIKEFRHHISLSNAWKLEQAQSMLYIGDCFKYLGQIKGAFQSWHAAFAMDGTRREPMMRLADHYYAKNDWSKACAYANAALVVKGAHFYSNNMAYYRERPHEILYVGLWWLGEKEKSRDHWKLALSYCPEHPKFQSDAQFYKGYLGNNIHGWMTEQELAWLHDTASTMTSVVEIGSWKGRSTHALCAGCNGRVTSVDHFKGSESEINTCHAEAVAGDIFAQFMANVGHFNNLNVLKMSGESALEKLNGDKFEMVFIDASHDYEDVKADLRGWKDKATRLICGHDYNQSWPGVVRAVKEEIGAVETIGSIWYSWKPEDG
jgi:glycosyltransferase involved in cell wall biosynthesis